MRWNEAQGRATDVVPVKMQKKREKEKEREEEREGGTKKESLCTHKDLVLVHADALGQG